MKMPLFFCSQAVLSEVVGWRQRQCRWFPQWWDCVKSKTLHPLCTPCNATPFIPSSCILLRNKLFALLVTGNVVRSHSLMWHLESSAWPFALGVGNLTLLDHDRSWSRRYLMSSYTCYQTSHTLTEKQIHATWTNQEWCRCREKKIEKKR